MVERQIAEVADAAERLVRVVRWGPRARAALERSRITVQVAALPKRVGAVIGTATRDFAAYYLSQIIDKPLAAPNAPDERRLMPMRDTIAKLVTELLGAERPMVVSAVPHAHRVADAPSLTNRTFQRVFSVLFGAALGTLSLVAGRLRALGIARCISLVRDVRSIMMKEQHVSAHRNRCVSAAAHHDAAPGEGEGEGVQSR